MNWGDIQIESLKKMFLNTENITTDNLENYKSDKKYKTYLFAMPQACNEAIKYIASRLGTETEKYTLEYNEENNVFDLGDFIPDMRKIKKVICPTGVKYRMLTSKVIQIDNWTSGDVDIYYELEVDVIKSSTLPTKKINSIKEEYVTMIPLYISGELYKDDDLSMATMYMNEFFNMISSYENENIYVDNPTIQTVYGIGD